MTEQTTTPREAIAVVGMGAILPMAPDVPTFWHNILSGRECLTQLDHEAASSGRSYVNVTGALERPYHFDADYFGYNKMEARLMDPQQRIMLECAVQAWTDAGLETSGLAERGSAFIGSTINTYLPYLLRSDPKLLDRFSPQQIMLAHDKDFTAARIARALRLQGSASTIQTACSSSLSAVHYAARSLTAGECDVALAGGASVRVPHWSGYDYVEGGTFSADGHIRSFDAAASGSIPGSGAGCVVLMRLADAKARGMDVYAVLRGSAIAIDGGRESASFTSTTAAGQAQAARRAWEQAGFGDGQIDFIECHGTGTPKGDPIEVRGLAQAFDALGLQGECVLTSAKPNIGHLDAAAGVAGFIKACLAVRDRTLPPQINFETPNPEIPWQDTSFQVAPAGYRWDEDRELRAAVNSLGMGGYNVHVALTSPPPSAPGSRPLRRTFVLPFSAPTESALAAERARVVAAVEAGGATEVLQDVLLHGRQTKAHGSVALVVDDTVREERPMVSHEQAARCPLWVLPGQGVLQTRMGLDLTQVSEEFAATFARLSARARDLGGPDLDAIPDEDPVTSSWWRDTYHVQTAVYVIQVASAAMVRSWGYRPSILLGHSLGELSALAIAGAYPDEVLLDFVIRRAAAIRDAPAGGMLSLSASRTEAEELMAACGAPTWIAAENSPRRTIAGGTAEALDELARVCSDLGVRAQRLPVARAFHTPLLDGARDRISQAYRETLGGISPARPEAPVVSSCLARPVRLSDLTDESYWVEQSLSRVRFVEAFQHPLTTTADLVLDLGPSDFAGVCAQQSGISGDRITLLPRRAAAGEDAAAQAHLRLLSARGERRVERARSLPGRRHAYPYAFDHQELSLLPEPQQGLGPDPTQVEPRKVANNMAGIANGHQPTRAGQLEADVSISASEVTIRIRAVGHDGAPTELTTALAPQPVAAPAARAETQQAAPVTAPAPPAGSTTRETVVQVFAEQLGLDPVPTNVPIDTLGADSLTLTHILSVLKEAIAPSLSMRQLTDAPSIDWLCEQIDGDVAGAEASGPTSPQDEPLWPALPSIADELAQAARENGAAGTATTDRGTR